MVKDENALLLDGIRFFGKMSASVTHEIKNSLAIINESAGLLEDLSVMSQNGHSLSPDRVTNISQRVTRQVQRADSVLKKLNRFSHSADQSSEMTNLEDAVKIVLDLSSRLIEMQQAVIEVAAPISAIMVSTNLFYLENLIWKALEAACLVIKEGKKKMTVSFGNDTNEPSIWFSMDTVNAEAFNKLFGSKEDKALMAHLNISIKRNKKNNAFGLLWTKRA